ncbi:MAG: NUDIX domain-containing protein [Candidatus Pacebacteria bacterium]|nr:NUDIX domain-containing protein [Candidatus Paceibacterota bacterium]
MNKSPQQVTCEDVEGKTYQVGTDQLTFRPAVYGVIVKDGKILMSKQWDGYDFPGGGIELGEPTDKALLREVKEETGLDVKMGRILHCEHSFFKLPFKGNFVHSIHMYYECRVVGGEISTEFLDEQEKQYADKPEWVDLSKITKVKIYSSGDTNKVLEKYL